MLLYIILQVRAVCRQQVQEANSRKTASGKLVDMLWITCT